MGLATSLLAMVAAVALAPSAASAATTVNGTVTVPAGVNAHNVRALLLDANGSAAESVTVTAGTPTTTGTYTFTNVLTGTYKIYFIDKTGADDVQAVYSNGVTTFAAATSVSITGDYTLPAVTLAGGGSITGTVSQPNAGASGTAVEACLVGTPDPGQSAAWGALTEGQLCSPGTASGNTYSVGGLIPGGAYQLVYTFGDTAEGYSDTAYVDGAGVTLDEGSATTLTPGSGSAAVGTFAIPTLGLVSGTVTDPSGVPSSAVAVELYDSAGSEITGNTTFVTGIYTVYGVLPGAYKVEFNPRSLLVATQYYTDAATLAAAAPITVSAGAATSSINATLTSAASVSGTVTAAQGGADLGGIEVRALDANGNAVASTFTAANGAYTLPGLPVGSFYLEFDGGQAFSGLYYTTEYYGGSATLAGSVPVKLIAGEALVSANQALMAASTTRPGAPTVASGKLSGLHDDKVGLSFKLTAGSGTAGYLQSFSIKLPKNVSWNKKGIAKDLVIAHDSYKETITKGLLVVKFTTGKKTASVLIKAGGITVTKGIEKLAAAVKIASYGIDLSASDTTGLTTSLSYTVKKPY